MFEFPRKTDKLRILISNDDGVRAPGIKVLHRIARELTDDVWICAPLNEQSGAGHSLTLRYPLWLRRLGTRRYAVEGTPTDSVLVGIHQALKDRKPDLVLSGINRGSNMGEFITYSGTCAAAMEATILGVPAIASDVCRRAPGAVMFRNRNFEDLLEACRRVLDNIVDYREALAGYRTGGSGEEILSLYREVLP